MSFETQGITGDLLLVSFCNQISSPLHSLCVVDPSSSDTRWIDLSPIPEDRRDSFSGICGIHRAGGYVLVVTQGAKPVLAIVDVGGSVIRGTVPLDRCKDAHSLVFHDGYIYVVSTGTNEIYRIPFDHGVLGTEELHWSYPGVGCDRDEVHLNGLAVADGRLIASCFGLRSEDGACGSNGSVFYLDTGVAICSGLRHPHTPLVIGSFILFAESAAQTVYAYRQTVSGGWVAENEIEVGGYARGLAVQNGRLAVGISASRKISRSRKTVNTGPVLSYDAAVITVDLATWRQLYVADLRNLGREIYDLLPVGCALSLCREQEAGIGRIRELESTVDRYVADVGLLWRRTKELEELVARQNEDLAIQRRGLVAGDAPTVSVIIPTYNRAPFVGDAVRSVLAQTFDDLEVIVVDDGSTDRTAGEIKSITDPRLQYVYQKNMGRSCARNRALRLARGRFITFLDSDDLYLPHKIELQVNYLNAHPCTDMVYTSAYCIDSQGRRLDHVYEASVSGKIYEHIAFFTPVTITLPTVMVRREVFAGVGEFDEQMHRFEDTDMWRRISKCHVIDAIPDYTCLLRTHDDNSLIAQDPDKIVSAVDYYAAKIFREDRDLGEAVLRRGLRDLYVYYGQALMSVPQWRDTGRKLMRRSEQYGPGVWLGLTSVAGNRLKRFVRSVYYRSLNSAYGAYSHLRKRARHLFGSISNDGGD